MSNSHSQSKGLVLLVPTFFIVITVVVLIFTGVRSAVAGNWLNGYGGYNSKFEDDSIRNQEEIIRLLREQNRILERSR